MLRNIQWKRHVCYIYYTEKRGCVPDIDMEIPSVTLREAQCRFVDERMVFHIHLLYRILFSAMIFVINLISSFVFPLYMWYFSSVFMWIPLLVMCVVCVVWKQAHFWDTHFNWPITVNKSVSHCESLSVTDIRVSVKSRSATDIRVSVSPWVQPMSESVLVPGCDWYQSHCVPECNRYQSVWVPACNRYQSHCKSLSVTDIRVSVSLWVQPISESV